MNNNTAGPSSKSRAGASQPSESSFERKRGMFQKDLHHMMYGFNDDQNPLPETVAFVEDIVVEYVTDLVYKAQDTASKRGNLLIEGSLLNSQAQVIWTSPHAGLSSGAISGISVSGVVGLLLCVGCFYVLVSQKKDKKDWIALINIC